jgi:hypothetical protein
LSFLISILNILIKLERKRKVLGNCPDFNIVKIFQSFDQSETKSISRSDFRKGLLELGILLKDEEIILIFNRLNIKASNSMTLNDFKKLFNFYHSDSNQEISLSTKTKQRLIDYFRYLIEAEKQIKKIIIESKNSINIEGSFNLLKGKLKNYIIKSDVYISIKILV